MMGSARAFKRSSGRVPHVRTSVHGTKKMGRSPFHCSYYATKRLLLEAWMLVVHGAKAFEKIVIGPCTLVRTWGTRPSWSGDELRSNRVSVPWAFQRFRMAID